MQTISALGLLLLSYLIGSVPFGLIIVHWSTGKDIRHVESGRTGGTNAMRAAGFWAGLATAICDLLKAALMVWLARWLFPGNAWLQILAPIATVVGHNFSIFLVERNEKGKLRFRGGAGGAPTVGGALGLWAPSILVIIPLGALLLYLVGYASVATMSVAVTAILLFSVLAELGKVPWQFILYGVFTLLILIYALRPNIRRLMNGTERLVGLRAKHRKQQLQE